jgi:hypothetical protein
MVFHSTLLGYGARVLVHFRTFIGSVAQTEVRVYLVYWYKTVYGRTGRRRDDGDWVAWVASVYYWHYAVMSILSGSYYLE